MGRPMIQMPKITTSLLTCLLFFSAHSTAWANRQAEQVFGELNRHFSTTSTRDQQYGQLLLLIVAGAVIAFTIWLAYQFLKQRKELASPVTVHGIYKKLCRIHNLTIIERYMLHKVRKQTGLDDPLPLFVEPKYFSQVLEDKNMSAYRLTIHKIMQKLFGYQQGKPVSQPTAQPNVTASHPADATHADTVHAGVAHADHMAAELMSLSSDADQVEKQTTPFGVAETFAQTAAQEADQNSVSENEGLAPLQTSGRFSPAMSKSKVTLNPIAGRAAFSTLVEPLNRVSTEIAASSIRHSLTDNSERNQRTFDASNELPNGPQEPQLPLFPKSKAPTPGEMLTNQAQRVDSKTTNSPTPQYLQQRNFRNRSVPSDFSALQPDVMLQQSRVKIPAAPDLNVHSPKPGEVLTLDEAALLENIVMGR